MRFKCVFNYIICLVAICPRFRQPKQCVACYFCSRYGFCHFLFFFDISWRIFTCFWLYNESHSYVQLFSTAETMCSTLFLLQVWFLSFFIVFLMYLDMFSVHFLLYNTSCSYMPSFSTAKTMCSTLFLLQVWFLSFIIIFLTYLDAFSVCFWLYDKSCSYVPPVFDPRNNV